VVRFRQEHRGYPVFEGSVVVAFAPDGDLLHVGSRYLPDLDLPTSHKISRGESIARAEEHLGSTFDELPEDPRMEVVRGGKGWPGSHLAWHVRGLSSDPLGD
jgi:hypothetical protein